MCVSSRCKTELERPPWNLSETLESELLVSYSELQNTVFSFKELNEQALLYIEQAFVADFELRND